MEQQLFAEYPAHKRKSMLQDNADAIEKVNYTKRFTHDELTQFKDELSTVSIDINSIEIEKKSQMDEFKAILKPLIEDHKELLRKIHNKAELVEEECFKMVDHENGLVGFYNDLGEMVYSRPILPNEKQATIFQLPNNAINS